MLRPQAALPPAWRYARGIPCGILRSLAHVQTLASLHPEGLCGFCLVSVSFLDSASFFRGTVLLTAFRQRPVAFVAYDALALLVSRVQVARAARALQARSLSPGDAKPTLHLISSGRIRGAPAPAWSSASSEASCTTRGLRNRGLLIGLLPRNPLGPPHVRDRARTVFSL